MADDWTGRTIDGRYAVEALLGQGGMGVVLRARHKFTGAQVALKMLKAEWLTDPQLESRFLAEARAGNQIGHPAIVQVQDAGRTPEGELYLVMELLIGQPLREAMQRRLPPVEIRRIARELLDALAAAHARGFVHRDLKPENVFLSAPSANVKLLDFGIAKGIKSTTIGLPQTAAGVLLGTLSYMAPEQLADASTVDPRADLWAIGVMLYEMIAGRLPFTITSIEDMFVLLAHGEPDPISRWVPTIAPVIEQFFKRALARDPNARFATAPEMAAAFAALPLEPIVALPVTPRPQLPGGETQATGYAATQGTGPFVQAPQVVQMPQTGPYGRATPYPPVPYVVTQAPPAASGLATQAPGAGAGAGDDDDIVPPRRSMVPVILALVAAAVIAVVIVMVTRGGDDNKKKTKIAESGSGSGSGSGSASGSESGPGPGSASGSGSESGSASVAVSGSKPPKRDATVKRDPRPEDPYKVDSHAKPDPKADPIAKTDPPKADPPKPDPPKADPPKTDPKTPPKVDPKSNDGIVWFDPNAKKPDPKKPDPSTTKPDPKANPLVSECATACSFMQRCGVGGSTCIANCEKTKGFGGCIAKANNDCDAFAVCFLEPSCGVTGRGGVGCTATIACQDRCPHGNLGCACQCAISTAQSSMGEVLAYNACSTACKGDKACVAKSCAAVTERCKAH